MPAPISFLIAGGTGRQGGAVVNALLSDEQSSILPKQIYVITRNLSGSTAMKLAARGVNLIQGDLNNPQPIFSHLTDSGVQLSQTAAFMAQAHGPTEVTDAQAFIDAAIASKIQYFVYSSADRGGKTLSDRDASYCKTFSDKFLIEKYLIAATEASSTDYTILRPVWFAENADWGFAGRLCMTGWRENMHGKRMQIVTTKDIGRWAVEALLRPDAASDTFALRNTAISIASDTLTFAELNKIYVEETGQVVGVTYGWLGRLMIWLVTDLRTMFAWIGEREYGAELDVLKRRVEPTTFRMWLREKVKIREES